MKKFLVLLASVTYLLSFNTALAASTQSTIVKDNESHNAFPDGVYFDYVIDNDQTDAAADTTSGDVYLPEEVNSVFGTSYLYVGSNAVFDSILFDISSAGSSSRICATIACKHYNLEYYNGVSSSWESLDYTDNTNNLKTTGQNSWDFTAPSAWDDDSNTKTTINSQTLYWVRLSAYSSTNVSTAANAKALALSSYNYQLTVTDQLGNALTGLLDADHYVTGGTANDISDERDLGSGVYQFGLDEAQSDSNYNFHVDMDGYVEESFATGVVSTVLKSASNSLNFTHKINVQNAIGMAIAPDSVYVDVTSPSVATVVCTISDTHAYCPLTTLQDGSSTTVTVIKSGYLSKTVSLSDDRSSHAESQASTTVKLSLTPTTSSSVGYVSIDVGNENGDAFKYLTQSNFSISGGTDNTIYGFTNNGDGKYVITLESANSDNDYDIAITRDAYVGITISTGSLVTSSTTSLDVSFMEYAYKVRVKDTDGNYLFDAVVNSGDAFGITCEYISSGYYGCANPLAHSDLGVRVYVPTYVIEYDEFSSDRVYSTDAQITLTVELEKKDAGTDCEVPFDDIFGHWAEPYVQELYCRDVVDGRDSDSFVPSDNMTRAEFLKVALLNAGYTVDGDAGEDFSDVSSGDWYYEYVSYGADKGFIEGYSDGTFMPNADINRAEALVILMRIAGVTSYDVSSSDVAFSDVSSTDWFAYAIVTASDKDIVEGYETGGFEPGNNITRAEVSAMAVRTHDAYYE